MSKTKEIKEEVQTKVEEPKMCMTFLKNIGIDGVMFYRGAKAKLSQSEIDAMHEKVKGSYPKQSSWIINTPKTDKNCNCK